MTGDAEYCRLCWHAYEHKPSPWGDCCTACIHHPKPEQHENFDPVSKPYLAARGLTLDDWKKGRELLKETRNDD